jgi:hypothetical protein
MERGRQDKALALKLYTWNHEIGEALNVTLQQFEICLRNGISSALADRCGVDWHKSHVIRGHNSDVMNEWDRASKKAQENRKLAPVRPSDFVAAACFNMWRELCKPKYLSVFWAKRLHLAFPAVTWSGTDHAKLTEIHRRVDFLVKLRNRIAHHEPILGSTREKPGDKLKDRHREMTEMLRWMDGNFAQWVVARDRFQTVLDSCPCEG